jgi:hypothetical protein
VEDVQAVAVGQGDVEQRQIRPMFAQPFHGVRVRGRGVGREAVGLEITSHDFPDLRLVVDDQNVHC